ncbi:MAG: hypothetical protein ACK56F_14515, partial [bacterium]
DLRHTHTAWRHGDQCIGPQCSREHHRPIGSPRHAARIAHRLRTLGSRDRGAVVGQVRVQVHHAGYTAGRRHVRHQHGGEDPIQLGLKTNLVQRIPSDCRHRTRGRDADPRHRRERAARIGHGQRRGIDDRDIVIEEVPRHEAGPVAAVVIHPATLSVLAHDVG